MRLRFLMPLVAIGFTAMSTLAHAQDAGALQQELQKQVPKPQTLPTPSAPKLPAKPQEAKPSEVKVFIKGFRIDGNKTLSEDLIKETLKPWLGKTVAFQELQKAADSVAALYQSQGFLAQVSVPPQRITDGIVILKVLEAKLGAVHVDMPNGPSRFGEDRARRYVTDANRLSEIVQTRNIERSIYILNETPGIAIASELQPGKNEGDVDLKLSMSDTSRVKGRLEANNHGSRPTGMGQRVVSLVFDGLLGFGDQLSASNIKSSGSDFSFANYSLPLNTDGLRLSFTGSYLDYENVGKFSFPQNDNAGFGRARTVGANLSYPTLRSPSANANLTGGVERKMYINKQVDGGDLRSDYRIENMNIGISGNIFDQWGGGGVTQGSATVTKGQLVFNNTSPQTVLSPYGTFTPTVFSKLNFVVSRNQQIVPDKTILNATISGQIASVDLDSAEKFYLGGPNGIKGYPGSQGAGSQGAMLNLELQQALDDKMIASVFYDAGFVQQWRDGGNFTRNQGATAAKNTYSLSSLGLGLKRPGKDITWSTVLAWKLGENPLRDNNGQGVNNDGRSKSAYLWAQMQWVF